MAQCRACLGYENVSVDLIDNEAVDIYSDCTSLTIDLSDILPKTLCDYCYGLLIKFYEFKQQCIRSDETLKELKEYNLSDIKNENITDKNGYENLDVKSEHKYELRRKGLRSGKILKELREFNPLAVKDEDKDDYDSSNIKSEDKSDVDDDGNDLSLLIENFDDNFRSDSDSDSRDESFDLPYHMKKKNVRKFKKVRTKNDECKLKDKIIQKRNILVVKEGDLYLCPMCGKKFEDFEKYSVHKKIHKKEKMKKCFKCGKEYKYCSTVRKHYERSHPQPIQCKICDKMLTTSTYRRHERRHKMKDPIMCHFCGKEFKAMNSLKSHLLVHQDNRTRNVECKVCNKKFHTRSTLAAHELRHRNKDHYCPVCPLKFFTISELKKHMNFHDKTKRHLCKICNKTYATRAFLVEHERNHRGEKPFNCDLCSWCFVSRTRLLEHRRTHTGEKRYKCEVCGHAFVQKGTMNRHKRTVHKLVTPRRKLTSEYQIQK